MKFLNKTLIITIILSCLCFSITYGEERSDCENFGVSSYKQGGKEAGFYKVNTLRETTEGPANFLTIDEQKAIIRKQDLNAAILNLKKYCCEHELGGLKQKDKICTEDKPFYNDNSLDSPYLFDHIFDVIMRRLNGLSGDNNIYKDMTLDDKGAERRSKITKYATSTGGSDVQSITNIYSGFRTQSSPELGYNIADKMENIFSTRNNQDFLSYVGGDGGGEESESVAKAMKNYSKWTLYDRYINACALSEYFYALLNPTQSTDSSDKIRNIYELSRNSCNKIVNKQIQGEADYVTLIGWRSSSKFQSNYINGYISYLDERKEKLQNLVEDVKNRWLDIVRAVPELQRKCQK